MVLEGGRNREGIDKEVVVERWMELRGSAWRDGKWARDGGG